MIIYKCDLCGEVRDCVARQIEQTEYDICAACWDELMRKLKDRGRKAHRHVVPSPQPAIAPDLPQEKPRPFPGQPPEIIANRTN